MAHPVVVRMKKLKTLKAVGASGGHQTRERFTANADPARSPLNSTLTPVTTAAELVAAVEARLARVTGAIRKDAVLALEYLFTAHQDAFRGPNAVDADAYLGDCLTYLQDKFGAENVVAAVIHRDESAPHLAAFVVPLVETEAGTQRRSIVIGHDETGKQIRETREYSRPAGVRLSAGHYVGNRAKLHTLQDDLGAIGERHGLRRGTPGSAAEHTTIRDHYRALNSADAPPALTSSDVQPRYAADHLLLENSAELAARLTRQLRVDYGPQLALASTARIQHKRAAAMSDTAAAIAEQLKAAEEARDAALQDAHSWASAFGGLPREEFFELVDTAAEWRAAAELREQERQAALAEQARQRDAQDAPPRSTPGPAPGM